MCPSRRPGAILPQRRQRITNPRPNSGRGFGKTRVEKRARVGYLWDLAELIIVVPQQQGVLFMRTQQVQPHLAIVSMQSQHAWIILQHSASPEVQVIEQPSLV